MAGSQDLRVVKTRRNLEETLVRLLERMPFDQVTVRLVVAEAMVNKGTFYRHYQDKRDLAEHAFARVMDEARESIRSRVRGMAAGAPFAELLASFAGAQADLMPKLMAFRGVPLETGSMESQVERLFEEEFARVSGQWGKGGQVDGIPGWVVSNLAMGLLRHSWETGEAADPRSYLGAVHHASGLYLNQLARNGG